MDREEDPDEPIQAARSPCPLLFGYDPFRDLPFDHLARLVEHVVEETVVPPRRGSHQPGQPPYDPRLCVKVLIYSYCIGVRSSRVMERNCKESLPYLFLTRGDAPSYRTLCTVRTEQGEFLEAVWVGLFSVAASVGIERLGRITLDGTKLRANASPEAVVRQEGYAALRQELERIQAEVARVDAQEAVAGSAGRTELGKTVPQEHMRDILRRVRQQRREARKQEAGTPREAGERSPAAAGLAGSMDLPQLPLAGVPVAASATPRESAAEGALAAATEPMSAQMLQRIAAGLQALAAAEAEGRKHLCLTDPDARMMFGGRERSTAECYSFEVAVDNGLLMVGQSSQESHDNPRLEPLVEAAAKHEPRGVVAVDADSGYYTGESIAALIKRGIDTCIPDCNTAGDLHRGEPIGTSWGRARGQVPFTYDPESDLYRCPEGNTLTRTERRRERGQYVTNYRAQASCAACPQYANCIRREGGEYRNLRVPDDSEVLEAARQRFAEPDHQQRYHHRGERVEGVFGFLRGTLGFTRWLLRGAKKVECEAKLFRAAYQFRKIHRAWAG